MNLHIDTTAYKCKPKESGYIIKPRLQNNNTVVDISLSELIQKISKGHSISPGVMKDGAKAVNWTQQQLFMVDIDNEADEILANKLKIDVSQLSEQQKTPILSVEESLKICDINNLHPAFYYHSFSHSEHKPKYRLCFIMDEVVKDTSKRAIIVETLISLFSQSDKTCKNADRIFYGTNKEVEICNENAVINLENIMGAYTPEPKTNTNKKKDNEELEHWKREFDFFNYLKDRNGETVFNNSKNAMFLRCELCGHKKDLLYYHETHTFYCCGAGCNKGGSIIDYLMIVENMTPKDAIAHFLYDMCGVEKRTTKPKKEAYDEKITQISQFSKEDSKLWIEFENCKWIHVEVNEKTGKEKVRVLPSILAEHIRSTQFYIFVRNDATNTVLRYWYELGCYNLISDEELKGSIKAFIPVYLQKYYDINEVFNLLITDLKFIPMDKLNSNENIINFQNGLLYLDTMQVKPHTHEEYSTIQIPCNYNNNVKPPESHYFDKFINHFTNGDDQVKSLLLQFMGVAFSNIEGWRLKKSLFMVGDGDTGKSQLKELTHKLLGIKNCSGISLTTLEERFGASAILNKRVSGSSDMSFVAVKELEIFKQATGGDNINTEFKNQGKFEFKYKGLFWFCMNKLPKFGGDRGDWVYNRIMVLECNNPVAKKDKYLQEKMFSESEYIVSLAINELQKVIKNDCEFIIPEIMEKANDSYKVTNDSFLSFMEECTEDRPNGKIYDDCTVKRFYDVYVAWCKDNNSGYSDSKKNIKQTLKNIGKGDTKTVKGYDYFSKFTLKLNVKKEYQMVYGHDTGDFSEKKEN